MMNKIQLSDRVVVCHIEGKILLIDQNMVEADSYLAVQDTLLVQEQPDWNNMPHFLEQ
jgi:hypothetical protein